LRRMEVPIFEQHSSLVACLPTALADDDLLILHDKIIEQVGQIHPGVVIVDIGALDVMDSFATRTFNDLAAKIRRQGSQMLLVGIQPDVAAAASRLGLKLDPMVTQSGLRESDLAYLS